MNTTDDDPMDFDNPMANAGYYRITLDRVILNHTIIYAQPANRAPIEGTVIDITDKWIHVSQPGWSDTVLELHTTLYTQRRDISGNVDELTQI